MAFNQEKFDAIQAEINATVDTLSGMAGTFAPEFLPYIILGKAVAKALPVLYEDTAKLIGGDEPTPDEEAALAKKIHDLGNPETL